jgi:hypothetical protein
MQLYPDEGCAGDVPGRPLLLYPLLPTLFCDLNTSNSTQRLLNVAIDCKLTSCKCLVAN